MLRFRRFLTGFFLTFGCGGLLRRPLSDRSFASTTSKMNCFFTLETYCLVTSY